MTTFLHVFTLTIGTALLFVCSVMLWMLGLMKPVEWLQDHDHLNLAVCYFFGYVLTTGATIAGIVAAAA